MDGLDADIETRLRCHRLVEHGLWISEEFPRYISTHLPFISAIEIFQRDNRSTQIKRRAELNGLLGISRNNNVGVMVFRRLKNQSFIA